MRIVRAIHTILVFLAGVITMMVFGVISIALSYIDRSGDIPHEIARFWGWLIVKLSGVRVRIKGIENLDLKLPQVIMVNHQGNFDIWILLAYLPVQFRWLIKHTLFRIPLLGLIMRRTGYIAVQRENPRQAVKALQEAENVLAKGKSIIIFPEGTRTLDGQVHEFKRGGFTLANRTHTPIVPITIDGSFAIMQRNEIWVHPQEVRITIHPPVPAANLAQKDLPGLIERVHQQIACPLH